MTDWKRLDLLNGESVYAKYCYTASKDVYYRDMAGDGYRIEHSWRVHDLSADEQELVNALLTIKE